MHDGIIVPAVNEADETRSMTRGLMRVPSQGVIGYAANHAIRHAVCRGMRESAGDFVAFMDADGSTAISELPRLPELTKDCVAHRLRYTAHFSCSDVVLPHPKKTVGAALARVNEGGKPALCVVASKHVEDIRAETKTHVGPVRTVRDWHLCRRYEGVADVRSAAPIPFVYPNPHRKE